MNPNLSTAEYMNRFEAALRRHRVPEWKDIAGDVRSHIAEAESHGKSLPEILAALGAPDALARAYAVELLMDPPKNSETPMIGRFFKILGLVIAGSFLSLIVTVVLGGFGVSFSLGGIILIAAAAIQSLGLPLPPHVDTHGMPPLLDGAIGLAMFAAGWGSLWLLRRYVRVAARTLQRALPGGAPRPA